MKSKEVNNEISALVKGFDIAYGKAIAPFNEWLIANLKDPQGRTINQIVNEGWKKFELSTIVNSAIVTGAVESATIKMLSIDPNLVINKEKLKRDILYKAWASDDRALNTRMTIANTRTRKYIANSVKADFSVVTNYNSNIKKINAQILSNGKVTESVLRAEVRSLTSDIRKLGFDKDYTKALADLEKKIASLSEMNYPTSDTKKAYKQFIQAVKKGGIEAFEKSVTEAVTKKSRYISRRIARTEQARASLDSYLLMYQDDDDVVGYRWRLSDAHRVTDICDINAQADFGLGSGVYPKEQVPQIPSHPQCTCYLSPVIIGDMPSEDKFNYSKGGNRFLKKLSTKEQNKLLGSVERGKAFRKGEPWDKVSVNKPKPQDLKTRFDNVIESKFL